MPIYEYQCQACGNEQEAIQKFSDPPLVTCEACDEEALKKVVSKTSFVLKGSGWYVTDYKDGGKSGKAAKESKSDSDSSSSEKGATKTASPDSASSNSF